MRTATIILIICLALCATSSAEWPIAWVEKAAPNHMHGPKAGLIDGQWYLAGGHAGGIGQNNASVYDFASDSWQTIASMQEPRVHHGAFVDDGFLYAFGGCSYWNVFHPSMEAYTPATDDWTYPGVTMPEQLRYFGFAKSGQTAYVVGGEVAGDWGGYRDTLWMYDIPTQTWSLGPSALLPSATHVTVAHDGKLYTFGGQVPHSGDFYDKTQIYDISSGTWSYGADMLVPTTLSAVGVFDGRIVLAGGETVTDIVAIVQVYDPVADSWQYGTDLPTAINDAVAVTYGDRLYVTDGHVLYEGIPEPATMSMLALGGLAVLRRKKK